MYICVLLFCILAVFVYLYDFATTACLNLAFMLQDLNKAIQMHQQKFVTLVKSHHIHHRNSQSVSQTRQCLACTRVSSQQCYL